MRCALVLLCLSVAVAHADRAQLAETRPCQPVPQGVTTQLVGDRLFVLRDDGMAWNGLWVITLTPRPALAERIAFSQLEPCAFRVVDDRLYVVGALPPEPPNVMGAAAIIHEPRVIVMDAQALSLEPQENAAGFPACDGPPDDRRVTKAVRSGQLTVESATLRGPRPGQQQLLLLRGDSLISTLDHDPLVAENYGAFCRTIHPSWLAREYACSDRAFADLRHTAAFDFLAIRWGTLVSVSSAGVAVHDLTTLDLVGSVALSDMQAMPPTISLR